MKRLAACLMIALPIAQDPPAGTAADAGADPVTEETEEAEESGAKEEKKAAPKPWDGTFAEGMAEVVRLAASDDTTAAIELTDRLLSPNDYQAFRAELEEDQSWLADTFRRLDPVLTWLGAERLPDRDLAEVRFARGLLLARLEGVVDAEREFELVRALAGPGDLRHTAIYALGLLDLAAAETIRAKIPEIAGTPATPPGPPVPGAQPAEDEPDPLDLARKIYLASREHFVERMRLDWQDEDTRANLELIVRRLRELDEIERQREEEEEQNQDQQDQESEGEPQDGESEESEGEDPQNQESEQEGEEQPPEDESEMDEGEPQDSEPEEPTEVHLTEEQMMQLLKALEDSEEAQEAIKQQMSRPRPGDRDW